jgi:NlpC/P60 family putative phage cell wall peptidase
MTPTRAIIVMAARRWIGTPYRHQASLPGIGCDCLGFVRGVWRDVIGVEPEITPPYSPSWAEAGDGERLLEALSRHFQPVARADCRPGDVLAFRFRAHLPATHLAILTTSMQMAHAHSDARVVEVPLGAPWRKRLAATFAFPGVID